MKNVWAQWMAGVLFGLVLVFSGCAERQKEEPVSQSGVEQEQPSIAGKSGTSEGTAPAMPGSEQEQLGTDRKQRSEKPERG